MLYEVVNKRSSVVEGSLTINDVNEYLDQIAQNMGKSYVTHPSSTDYVICLFSDIRDIQSKILQYIYNRSTPEEQRWIVRIILKGTCALGKETGMLSCGVLE